MAPYDPLNFNFWSRQSPENRVRIDCLMPNGLCITREVQADTVLKDFKSDLWNEAGRLPLFHLLKDSKFYVLSCIDRYGGIEELIDEDRSIYDVQPFKPYFKIVEKQGDDVEKLVNSKISMLIGKSVTEFESLERDEEIRAFRRKFRMLCHQLYTSRRRASWEERAEYAYPPQFGESHECPKYLLPKMKSDFIVNVSVAKGLNHSFQIPYDYTVKELIEVSLEKKCVTLQLRQRESPDDYVLKIAGKYSFLFGRMVEDLEPKLLHYKVC